MTEARKPWPPLGRWFHGLLLFTLVWLWWSLGLPGFAFYPTVPLCAVVVLFGAVWFVRLVQAAERRMRGGFRVSRSLLAAPILVAAFALSVAADTPFRVRWSLSRDAFNRAAQTALEIEPSDRFIEQLDGRVGAYNIRSVDHIGHAVVFWEWHGALFDDAGFAYIPGGPTDDLWRGDFEVPSFHHIEGDWYTWTASW